MLITANNLLPGNDLSNATSYNAIKMYGQTTIHVQSYIEAFLHKNDTIL